MIDYNVTVIVELAEMSDVIQDTLKPTDKGPAYVHYVLESREPAKLTWPMPDICWN